MNSDKLQDLIDLAWGILTLIVVTISVGLMLWWIYEIAYQTHVETQIEKHNSLSYIED